MRKRPEAAEGLQSLKQPASDKQRGPPGERSFEEKHRKTLGRKKREHEIRPECRSVILAQSQISAAELLSSALSPDFLYLK